MVALKHLTFFAFQACANHPPIVVGDISFSLISFHTSWCLQTFFFCFSFVAVPFASIQRRYFKVMFYSGVWLKRHFSSRFFFNFFSLMSLSSLFQLFSGASLSDRSQTETNIGEERISLRRSLTDSLAVSSMLLLQPQQVSFL